MLFNIPHPSKNTPSEPGIVAFANSYYYPMEEPVAKFIVPDWVDKVKSDIGLSYRAPRLYRLAGRYDNPISESTISPGQGL